MSLDHTTRKCYLADTGLLITHAFRDKSFTENYLYKSLLFDKISINKGMFTENVVAQMLKSIGHSLYFYSRVDANNRANHMEIDFLIRLGQKITPIEVKPSKYRKQSSLDKFTKKFRERIGTPIILFQNNIAVDTVVHLPLYMTQFLL